MKRKILVIGIGAGNPEYVTVQAINAMNASHVFFVPDKGAEKAELAQVRRDIVEAYVRDPNYRTVAYEVPKRRAEGVYERNVEDWHEALAAAFGRLIAEQLSETETGAFLVWGDPALYDSTLRILERVRATAAFELEYEVIPGVSSVSKALAARHRVALNAIGRAVLLTNGRALKDGLPEDVDSAAVLLNADKALRSADGELEAFWGAYVGMPNEILVSGRLKDVADEIEALRAAAREKNGWIMDCLLLKKP